MFRLPNDPLKECFTVKCHIILLSGRKQILYLFWHKGFSVHVQYGDNKELLVSEANAHTLTRKEKMKSWGKSPTSPRWSQSMEPSSYQLTPVACSQRSRAREKEARRGEERPETGHWFRVRRLSWALISTSLSITQLTLLSHSLYFNLSIIPLICVAFLPSAFAKGQITWKGRQNLNRSQTVSSMRGFACVCEWESLGEMGNDWKFY